MTLYVTGAEVYQLITQYADHVPARLPAEEVESKFIVGLEARVNGILRKLGYTVPVTGADATLVAYYLRRKAVVDVLDDLWKTESKHDFIKRWDLDWEDFLRSLADGEMVLEQEIATDDTTEIEGQVVVSNLRVLPRWSEDV